MAKKFTASSQQLARQGGDPKYNSKLVAKFINCLMWGGKKSVAQRVFYDAIDIIAKNVEDTSPLEVFETAINNVKPLIEVRSRRIGGASYQVPTQVSAARRQSQRTRRRNDYPGDYPQNGRGK